MSKNSLWRVTALRIIRSLMTLPAARGHAMVLSGAGAAS
jgi:hypothetical protein